LLTPWNGTREQEEELSKKYKIAIRCMPNNLQNEPESACFLTGKATPQRALWGRSY
jgi:prolyl-tRNA synthetase